MPRTPAPWNQAPSITTRSRLAMALTLTSSLSLSGCPDKQPTTQPDAPPTEQQGSIEPEAKDTPALAERSAPAPSATGDGLVLAYSRFEGTKPAPARFELVYPTADGWRSEVVDDGDSNVFHKLLPFPSGDAPEGLLSLGASKARVKLWRREGEGWRARTLWEASFGGKFDRMRDAELGDVDGDGVDELVVGTHDQGVMAILDPDGENWKVEQIDRIPDTFIHEVELGDLDGDGKLEIYATPSEPNKLDTGAQPGRVVRYRPGSKPGHVVVAELGERHAKEIYVGDVDGDGRDELYVAVEALTSGTRGNVKIEKPVEIRRYDADTRPDAGKVVATLPDRFCRFLTVGDLDGDGSKEMVAAAFRTGVWLLKPGKKGVWTVENIEQDSSAAIEHAALATDLDGDGRDELYVAADDQGQLRRYTWQDGKIKRETLLSRDNPRAIWTWNISAVPRKLLP